MNLIENIKKMDEEISKFFEKKELEGFEKLYNNLEVQHKEIKSNLKKINYLLELIEKHKVEENSITGIAKKIEKQSNWLSKIKGTFESFHLLHTDKLSAEDLEYLQKEKNKLNFEKEQLEKEHHNIHQLLAKSNVYLNNLRNSECEKITNGYNIAGVGEKLLEHFGKIIDEETSYNLGRKTILEFLENFFSLNKIEANNLFVLLEKDSVLHYEINYSNAMHYQTFQNSDQFTNLDYTPILGKWYINA